MADTTHPGRITEGALEKQDVGNNSNTISGNNEAKNDPPRPIHGWKVCRVGGSANTLFTEAAYSGQSPMHRWSQPPSSSH